MAGKPRASIRPKAAGARKGSLENDPGYRRALVKEIAKGGPSRVQHAIEFSKAGGDLRKMPPRTLLAADMVGGDPFFLQEQINAAMQIRLQNTRPKRRPGRKP